MPLENTEQDQKLHDALREWRLEPTLPPRFNERVWQRIAKANEGVSPAASLASLASLWIRGAEWIHQSLARPALAVSYVTLLLVTGLVAGYWQAKSTEARAFETLSTRYVQMLDPYQAPAHVR
jgi:hypothetical protein